MKFAHLSDVHLGFQKSEALQQVEQQVFEDAIDQCIEKKVDFILIPGDLFHVNIPEMRVQKFAVRKFRAELASQIADHPLKRIVQPAPRSRALQCPTRLSTTISSARRFGSH